MVSACPVRRQSWPCSLNDDHYDHRGTDSYIDGCKVFWCRLDTKHTYLEHIKYAYGKAAKFTMTLKKLIANIADPRAVHTEQYLNLSFLRLEEGFLLISSELKDSLNIEVKPK